MKKIFNCIIGLLLLTSCTTSLRIAKNKLPEVKDLGVCWTISEEVNDLDKIKVDSVMTDVLNKYNSERHNFSVHRCEGSDENTLFINFENGRFVKPGAVTAGYIVTAIGVLVCPIAVLAATEGAFIAAFWFSPQDRMYSEATLSANLSKGPNSKARIWSQTRSMFRSRSKRLLKINSKLSADMYKLITDLNK